MGKKHKKESKKRKHHSKSRSRSRSLDRELEKEKKRHHKRHHKKKEKCVKRFKSDVSSVSDDDVEFIPNTPAPPKISKGGSPSPPPPPKISIPSPPPSSNAAPKKEGDSLSIADTNILRAKLGLKPLQISEEKPVPVSNGSVVIEGGVDMGEFVHKPAEDLTSKKNTEKIRAKLAERREKRDIERKIKSVKGLGEDDSDSTIDDTLTWVSRNRKIENDRMLAMKKAKELDEMDEEFGIGELVQEELKKEKSKVYTSTDLKGLTVEHDINQFHEGRAVILTLKDKGVLDEDVDRLINVNLIDDERHKKNVLNRKKKPFGFSGLDIDEMGDEDDEKKVLSKYDEEIDGEKKSSFKLGPDAILRNKEAVKQKLQAKAKMTLESLQLPELKVASDYYSEAEMQAKFKKPKKTRKVRKKTLKADDLAGSSVTGPRNQDFGSRNGKLIKEEVVSVIGDEHQSQITSDSEQMDIDSDIFENIKIENPEEDMELELALKKARRLKHLELKPELSFPPDIVKNEVEPSVGSNTWIPSSSTSEFEDSGVGSNIVMNSTAEFCRTLGDIPTYGLSGNRDEEAPDLLDFEKELKEQNKKQEENNDRGGWNDAEMDDKLVDIRQVEAPILDAEPNLGAGVAGALRLAMSKGYLEKETSNRPSAARFAHLQAQNYSIEDKAHAEDEKFGRRERYMGPTSEFKEKEMYKPNIKLEYIDDEGHLLSAKEAFRYLSHKFHGKGPGKNKVEKRMKKGEQQVLMKQMSSTDTPLGTLQMLQQKQKETQSAFVVLSGSKQLSGPTSISKAKLTK